MPGDFNRITNIKQFEQVLTRLEYRMDQDPLFAHREVATGLLGDMVEVIGPWEGRAEERWEIPGAANDARLVGRRERAHQGDYDMHHIVAEPGAELAGPSYERLKQDFKFGGKPPEKAAAIAMRPQREWNRTVNRQLLDVALQGAFLDTNNDFTEGFAPSFNDFHGNSISFDQATEDSDQVADVVANSTQSVSWPLADGETTSTGHDHVESAAGSTWSATNGRDARDDILEHPGNGGVIAYAGSNVAQDIISVLKSEYGAISERIKFVTNPIDEEGPWGKVDPLGRHEGVDYLHSPDIPDDIIAYKASNKQPFYVSIGMMTDDGEELSVGQWTENLEENTGGEIQGLRHGYRRYVNMGCHDPTAVYLQEITA